MLEDACHLTGINLAAHVAMCNGNLQQPDINKYIEVRHKVRELELAAERLQEQMSMVQEALSSAIMNHPENEMQIKDIYQVRLNHLNTKMIEKVRVYLKINLYHMFLLYIYIYVYYLFIIFIFYCHVHIHKHGLIRQPGAFCRNTFSAMKYFSYIIYIYNCFGEFFFG